MKGDILIEMYHITTFYRPEQMLRVQFHTGFINQNQIRFYRFELDDACQDKRFFFSFFSN